MCDEEKAEDKFGRLMFELFRRGRRMQKVLVTGGNIGNHVAELLARQATSVRVLVRSLEPNRRWGDLGIEQVAADAGNPVSLARAFEGTERFFSVSPLVENLVELGNNTIEAAKNAGVRYIVRSSALGAGEKAITIGRLHREVEKAIEASGIPYTVLQPNTFMQSYLRNAETISKDRAFYLPMGNGKVSVIDVHDIAAVAVACLTEPGHEGKTYVLAGPDALSNYDVAEKLTTYLGRTITCVDVNPSQAEETMKQAGMSTWIVRALLELFEICKDGYANQLSPAVEQILKRKATSFEEFLGNNPGVFGESVREVHRLAERRRVASYEFKAQV